MRRYRRQPPRPRYGGRVTSASRRTDLSLRASATHHRKYHRLAAGPYHEPVVTTARAYLAAAIDNPRATEGEYWALSCLPGTTRWRLSALTMRTMDALVVNKPREAAQIGVQALMIVVRSVLDGGFGGRQAARDAFPALEIVDSEYYEAGPDQVLIQGPWRDFVAALAHPVVVESVALLATRMMGIGRTLHFRGHNRLLVADVLDDDPVLTPPGTRPAPGGP